VTVFQKREALRKNRYVRAKATALRLADILAGRYRARRIILIGSLTNEDRFDLHSDIDIAVEGLDSESYFRACGDLMICAEDFDVDLVPVENATPRMKSKISRGEVLYG
jgi:predicted nucleotidyltransferase